MLYPNDHLTDAERAKLAPFVTNLDSPVFALHNLPEATKGALFARYSRYAGTLRRLMIDEFFDDLPDHVTADAEGDRTATLYDRIFLGYGDDSVAQLGGVHLACEWASNLLTKTLERPRLGAYLEQSTRYIAFDEQTEIGYRFHRGDGLDETFVKEMNAIFDIYAQLLDPMTQWVMKEFPLRDGEKEGPWQRAARAKALDLLRGLLPAATMSHVGIFATGQTYEGLVKRLLASPLPEEQAYGAMMLEELTKVVPSFMARLTHPEKSIAPLAFVKELRAIGDQWGERLNVAQAPDTGASVRLLHTNGTEEDIAVGLLYEHIHADEDSIRAALQSSGALDDVFKSYVDVRGGINDGGNRRYKPGRGFERASYRFEITSDYGAFRDLQRHRLLTVQWQQPTTHLGADVPDEVEQAGLGDQYRQALQISDQSFNRLIDVNPVLASYAVCFAYRMRYFFDLNAREAMHLIELRSGKEGHPSYRAVAIAMQEEIRRVHPRVAAAMTHVDTSSGAQLERLLAEIRNEQKQTPQ